MQRVGGYILQIATRYGIIVFQGTFTCVIKERRKQETSIIIIGSIHNFTSIP